MDKIKNDDTWVYTYTADDQYSIVKDWQYEQVLKLKNNNKQYESVH